MSNFLLLFFAIPVAIIILSIIFETLINCPIKIAGITFSILLIVTFAVADQNYLIFTIIYTILSYVVAWITKQWMNNNDEDNTCNNICNNNTSLETLIQNINEQSMQNTLNQNNSNCGCNRRR